MSLSSVWPTYIGVREATDLIGLVSVSGRVCVCVGGGGVLIGWHCAN